MNSCIKCTANLIKYFLDVQDETPSGRRTITPEGIINALRTPGIRNSCRGSSVACMQGPKFRAIMVLDELDGSSDLVEHMWSFHEKDQVWRLMSM